MEIIEKNINVGIKPSFAIFDFDGTISTLRQGWENIMEPMMLKMICGNEKYDEDIVNIVKNYIDESTGVQTIYQMQWLVEKVLEYGINKNMSDDPWWYKKEYNRNLTMLVRNRKELLERGVKSTTDFMIKGSKSFLNALQKQGVEIYIASGTDHADVVEEVEYLHLGEYINEIVGAPINKVNCSKEALLRKLIKSYKLKDFELLVVGDGKVEIGLGKEKGARTLGVASDEIRRSGVNEVKKKRLINAGAHAITGDFEKIDLIMEWLGF